MLGLSAVVGLIPCYVHICQRIPHMQKLVPHMEDLACTPPTQACMHQLTLLADVLGTTLASAAPCAPRYASVVPCCCLHAGRGQLVCLSSTWLVE